MDVKEWVARAEVSLCAFGGPRPTKLRIVRRLEKLGTLSRGCAECTDPTHQHKACADGEETVYPVAFAKALSLLIKPAPGEEAPATPRAAPGTPREDDPSRDAGVMAEGASGVDPGDGPRPAHGADLAVPAALGAAGPAVGPDLGDSGADRPVAVEEEPKWFRPSRMPGWWAVEHTTPRRRLFVPKQVAAGPDLRKLSRRRWTYIQRQAESGPCPEEETDLSDSTTGTEMPFWWTGASYFRELDMEEEEGENDYRRWGPDMVRGMIRGVGTPKHPALVKDFSVIDIERELLIQKQLDCPTFGAI